MAPHTSFDFTACKDGWQPHSTAATSDRNSFPKVSSVSQTGGALLHSLQFYEGSIFSALFPKPCQVPCNASLVHVSMAESIGTARTSSVPSSASPPFWPPSLLVLCSPHAHRTTQWSQLIRNGRHFLKNSPTHTVHPCAHYIFTTR